MNRHRKWLVLLAALLPAVQAHIIPPEKFHSAAESFRRMNFILNLNPVRWGEVRKDLMPITEHLSALSPEEGKAYKIAATKAIDAYTNPPEGEEPGPAERKAAARKVFELSTRAVARTVVLHLKLAERALDKYSDTTRSLNEARKIAEAFEHEIRATDTEAFTRLGMAWLELSSSMGNPGIMKVGAVAANRQAFSAAARTIADYMNANYVQNFDSGKGKLLPLPRRSPTFDSAAQVPIKLPPGHNINKQIPRPRQILNMAARGVDESETPLIAMGDMAFDSAYIFGEPARSISLTCNTCHNKGVTNPKFFIPGLSDKKGGLDVTNSFFAGHANNGHFGQVDIPDMRGLRFTAPYGRNGRFATLREFTRFVIKHEFNGPEPDPLLLDGMIAYILEFDFLPNEKLKEDGTLSAKASASAKRGEKLFNKPFKQMSGKSCSSCHIPSDHFIDRKSHDIGSTMGMGAEPNSRDGAFDTPTLLNAKFTAPYFHDGSLPTLRSVVEWFDGRFKLNLKKKDVDDLTAYLDAVGDGKDSYEDTPYYLDAEVEEFSFFLSAYEFLKEKNKPGIISTTFQTIASELRNHKWELQDQKYLTVMERMAELMDEAYEANEKNDRAKTDKLVAEYRMFFEKNVENLK